MLIAQISDMHIKAAGVLLYKRIDTAGYLERAVAHVMRLDPRPDIVIATGDLVDGGKPEEYALLRELLAPLAMPVYLIPGNHDARHALREAFADQGYLPASGYLQYAIDEHPVRLLALDTLADGKPHGELCEQRLGWLEARLGEQDRPTLLFMHHPPFDCGIEAFDRAKLKIGGERLADIVRRNPHVERVMCGHVHRPIQTRWAGTMASIAPSTAHQATLDLREGAPLSMTMDPPGLALHQWRRGSGLVTHVSYVGDFEGPRPFG
ncbi:MAG TPA: phosphodiesterase [Reyranella sp.]|jgi:3',5'-cyclic AMP phosphodiesterase CpdA|nr:phosphodiesterase [Reyranella sp.]